MRILALSGSLRAESANTAALKALARLGGTSIDVVLYEGLAALPFFNPDLDVDPPAPSVAELRSEFARSNAVVICSPEYAHGVPGALKNALDWLVSGIELTDKPVALVNTSPWSSRAQASLQDVLSTMGARLVPAASVSLPLRGRRLDPAEIAADPEFRVPLLKTLIELERAAK
jgi:NAD(P)H-dependent FMN reductase